MIGCHPEPVPPQTENNHLEDKKYDSEFPGKPVSGHIKKIIKSIHLVSVLTFYESYYFDENTAVTKSELLSQEFDLNSHKSIVFEQPSSGTATLIYQDNKKLAFLTCAHIVSSPDTIITYYRDANRQQTKNINYFIKKVRQTSNIINQPVAYDFEILALDETNDIAILGKVLESGDSFVRGNKPGHSVRVLDLPLGSASELDWGTFVYIIGFPRAKKMISTAVVSSPNYDADHSFILDAALQKGISGGVILAIRDGIPNFELVGMVKGISGRVQYSLVPDLRKGMEDWEVYGPYKGEIHVEKQEIVEPGMLYSTSIEMILSFINEHKDDLQARGYNIAEFFK